MLTTLLTAVSFFAAAVLAHLALCRFLPSGKFMRDGLLTGLAVVLAASACQFRAGRADFVALYLLLTVWLAYLMFFINLLNSATLKMLECLAAAPDGAMAEGDFASIFNEESGLKARLSDMEANGFVKVSGGSCYLTGKAAWFLAIVRLLKKLLAVDAAP